MATLQVGSWIEFNSKVNIDPLGSHCSLCGRRTKSKLWFPVNWAEVITSHDDNDMKGYFPIGSECAKRFEQGIVVERN